MKLRMMRSRLFVPGSRPELFDKAMRSGADVVCFDLQDAVAPDSKERAREAVANYLRNGLGAHASKAVMVRVNALDSGLIDADLAAVVVPGLQYINLPMIACGRDVEIVCELLSTLEAARRLSGRIEILANIETPRSLRLAGEIADADLRVFALQAGFGDLFEPCGIDRGSAVATNHVRMTVRLAAAETGRLAYDAAFTAVSNLEGYRNEAEAARQLGFSGKSCIHPSQIAIANSVFLPSEQEVAWARKVVEAGDRALASGVGAILLDGYMIDAPFVEGARALLVRAEQSDGKPSPTGESANA